MQQQHNTLTRTPAPTHAGGLVLNSSTKLALGQGAAPTLTIMGTPSKQLMLMGIFDSTGSVTGACTHV
jgi:hypothetical protein